MFLTCSFTACLNGARISSMLPSMFCPSRCSNQRLLFLFLFKQTVRDKGLTVREEAQSC